ncbi:MAG: zinc-binding dehydrogenase [Pseudomonadota bacterium]
MQGAVFTGGRKVTLETFDDPVPGEGEVIVEIKASGMCGSDLHFYRADGGAPEMARKLGLGGDGELKINGHEPCGVVAARGPGVPEKHAPTGQRVTVHHYAGCETCPDCKEGWSQLCRVGPMQVFGVTGHGAHAQYMKVPAFTLVPLPDEVSFEVGAALSCGTTTAYGALKRMNMTGGKTLAIFGQGPVGLSGVALAKAMGLDVIALDVSDDRLALATRCGADDVINVANEDAVEGLRKRTGGRGVHYALEASANEDARIASIRGTRVWGTVAFVGEGGQVTVDVSPDLLRRQLTLIGSWTFSSGIQGECTRFVADNGVDIGALITDTWPLSQIDEAYRKFDQQQMGKGIIRPGA